MPTSDHYAEVQPIAGRPMDFEYILEAAKALAPSLKARGAEIDECRRLPEDVVQALREGGAFRMNMPKIWGGPELTSQQQIDVIEEYAKGNASVAWCVMIGSDSGLYSSWLEDAVAREMYTKLDTVQAGWVYPVGKAVRVEGGFEITGQWMFGSGCQHADWIGAGCWVFDSQEQADSGEPSLDWQVMIAPAGDFELLDTWYTTGLRGTGSTDYRATKLFIPEGRSFSFMGGPRRRGTLYAGQETFLRKMVGIPLGVAQAALDDAKAMLATKLEMPLMVPYREMPRVQTAIAQAEMTLGAARAYHEAAVGAMWNRLEAGEVPTPAERAASWLARVNVFQSARDVVRGLFDVVGASAVYTQKSAFDLYLRDLETMCQHVIGQRKGLELVGGLLLSEDGMAANPFLNPPVLAT